MEVVYTKKKHKERDVMNERSELHSWLCETKLDYHIASDPKEQLRLRHLFIKLERIYKRMWDRYEKYKRKMEDWGIY
jgi:hypothetical protein